MIRKAAALDMNLKKVQRQILYSGIPQLIMLTQLLIV